MNRKVKLATSLAGLFGLGGAGVVAVQNGLSSGLYSSAGGALSLASSSYSSDSVNLKIKGENINSLVLEVKKQLGDINLNSEDQEELLKILLTGDDISSNHFMGSASTIYGEVGREGTVNGIQSSVEGVYQSGTKKKRLRELFSDLQNAFKKIKQWEGESKKKVQEKSLSDSRQVPVLTKNERIALKTFFVVYSSLSQRRNQFQTRLQRASVGFNEVSPSSWVLTTKSQEEPPLHTQIQNALNKINWDKDKIKVKESSSRATFRGARSASNLQNQNLYGWGVWSQNPYKNFFDSPEEFQKEVESINSSKISLEQYLSSKRLEGLFATFLGPDMVKHVYKDYDKYVNAVEDAHSSVELHVGKKLMNWMGRQ